MDTLIDAAEREVAPIEQSIRAMAHPGLHVGARRFIARYIVERHFQRPVSPQRWKVYRHEILRELRARAVVERSAPREVLSLETIAALYCVVGEVDLDAADLFGRVQRAIQNTVCASLLGPSWRRSGSTRLYEHEDIEADPAVFDMKRAFEHLAQNDPDEAELLLNAASGDPLSSTMRQRVSRARKKLRTACHEPPR